MLNSLALVALHAEEPPELLAEAYRVIYRYRIAHAPLCGCACCQEWQRWVAAYRRWLARVGGVEPKYISGGFVS
jgi:hypothetical protein